jgi:serine protease inhibitor
LKCRAFSNLKRLLGFCPVMRTRLFLAPWLLAACSAPASTEPASIGRAPAQSGEAPEQAQAAALTNRAFGVKLFHRLATEPGNIFLSPISLAGAFGPVAAGAQGETRVAIGKVLGLPNDDAIVHRDLGSLLRTLESDREGARVSIANALWLMKGFAVKPGFVAVAKNSYNAEVDSLDFRNGTAAAARINNWVGRETRGRIPKLVEPDSLDEMTALVVTNAVHFLGDWMHPFNASNSRSQPFYSTGETVRNVPMMYGKRHHRYAEADAVQLLELPYQGDRLSMVAILPKKRGGLAEVEKSLDGRTLGDWLGQLDTAQPSEVRVHLPKVEFRTSYQLVEPLKALGMSIAFQPHQANFRGIGDTDLFISQVVHKTFLRIDEKGTEAAAATGIEVEVTSANVVPPPTFRADHPFLVLILDKPTGSVLFLGRIADPSVR